MNAETIFWILVIFYIIIDVIAAIFLAEIAKEKGHSFTQYLCLCLICGLAGWIMVAALPDRCEKEESKEWKHNTLKKEKIEKVANEMGENENDEVLNEFISKLEQNK